MHTHQKRRNNNAGHARLANDEHSHNSNPSSYDRPSGAAKSLPDFGCARDAGLDRGGLLDGLQEGMQCEIFYKISLAGQKETHCAKEHFR